MKKLVYFIIINILIITNSQAYKLSIVSDLDDTIKVTNSGSLRRAVWNAFFSTKAFAGMPTLLEDMESYTNDLYILSASPRLINKKIRKFLKKNDINYKKLNTRKLKHFRDKFKYKYNVVKSILEDSKDNLILIGDDVEIDQDVYVNLRENYQEKIDTIYIHKVTNKKLNSGVVGYFTALDIQVNEYIANRMELEALLLSIDNFNKSTRKKMNNYFPKFKYCPKDISEFNVISKSEIKKEVSMVYKKIITYCKSR
jgi:phosphatidate phosphatase APP1